MNMFNCRQNLHFSRRNNSKYNFKKIIGVADTKYFLFFIVSGFLLFGIGMNSLFAQVEVTTWGNLNGLRIEGQLIKIPTSMCLIGPSMAEVTGTGKEKQICIFIAVIETVTKRIYLLRETVR